MRSLYLCGVLLAIASSLTARDKTAKSKGAVLSPLDEFVHEASQRRMESEGGSPGSLYTPVARLGDLTRDPRANHVDDLVTILVADRASAVSKATTASQRKSSAKATIAKLAGPTKAGGPLADLTDLSGDQALQGQGSTTRQTTVDTSLAARVVQVLPNGLMVVEGTKLVAVNSENQSVTIRGVARPADIAPGNLVRSDRLANLEVRINGKGVVGDAVRRPSFLYRLLLGLLPF